ncbi:MAG: hypothetical protein R3B99_17445 [Polyangiales bacterium]
MRGEGHRVEVGGAAAALEAFLEQRFRAGDRADARKKECAVSCPIEALCHTTRDGRERVVVLEMRSSPHLPHVGAPRRGDRRPIVGVEVVEQVQQHHARVERIVGTGARVARVARSSRDAEAQCVLEVREATETHEAANLAARPDEERRQRAEGDREDPRSRMGHEPRRHERVVRRQEIRPERAADTHHLEVRQERTEHHDARSREGAAETVEARVGRAEPVQARRDQERTVDAASRLVEPRLEAWALAARLDHEGATLHTRRLTGPRPEVSREANGERDASEMHRSRVAGRAVARGRLVVTTRAGERGPRFEVARFRSRA